MSLGLGLLFIMNSSLEIGGWTPDRYEVLFTNPVCPRQRFVSYRPRNPPPETLESSRGPVRISPDRDEIAPLSLDAAGIPTLGGGKRDFIPANVFLIKATSKHRRCGLATILTARQIVP